MCNYMATDASPFSDHLWGCWPDSQSCDSDWMWWTHMQLSEGTRNCLWSWLSYTFSGAHLKRCCWRGMVHVPQTPAVALWPIVAQRLAAVSSESHTSIFFREETWVSWEKQVQKSSCSVTVSQKEGGHILSLAKPKNCPWFMLSTCSAVVLWSVRHGLMIIQQEKAVWALHWSLYLADVSSMNSPPAWSLLLP